MSERIDLLRLLERERAQTEWKENVADVDDVVHRDYELLDPLRITAFPDRVEVLSPGGLPLGSDPATLAEGNAAPHWRNQALAWFLTRLGYAEAEGQGIRTIQNLLQATGAGPARYTVDPMRVQCVLPAHPRASTGA